MVLLLRAPSSSYSVRDILPALRAAHAQGLVDAVDGFCEGIAFSPAQIARVFDPLGILNPGKVFTR